MGETPSRSGLFNGGTFKGEGGTVGDRGTAIVAMTEHHDDRGCHVTLRGQLDVRTVADLRLRLHGLIAGGSSPVLLDLGEVHVADATGFGFIVECLRRSRVAGRPLRIVAADDRTRRLLRRARLSRLLAGPPVDARPLAAAAG